MDNTTQSTDEQVMDSDRNLVYVVVMADRAASKEAKWVSPTQIRRSWCVPESLLYASNYEANGAPLAGHPVTCPRRIR